MDRSDSIEKIEGQIRTAILSSSSSLGRSLLGILTTHCPPPLHRWFTSRAGKIVALAFEESLRGTMEPTGEAVMGWLLNISWGDAQERIYGKSSHDDTPALVVMGTANLTTMDPVEIGVGFRALVRSLRHASEAIRAEEILTRSIEKLRKADYSKGSQEIIGETAASLSTLMTGDGEQGMGSALHSELDRAESQTAERTMASWGYQPLDDICPLRGGRLYVVAAHPGGGKTSLALQAAAKTAETAGIDSVAFASIEMRTGELATILAGRCLGLSPSAIEENSPAITPFHKEKLRALADKWSASPAIWVIDAAASAAGIHVETLANWATVRAVTGKLRLVILDYLQLLANDGNKNETAHLTAATRALKLLAQRLNVPVVILSQFSREGRKEIRDKQGKITAHPEPRLSDLRGSGSIEQDADAVLFLHREAPNDVNPTTGLRLILAKNRKGRTLSINATFARAQQEIREPMIVPDQTQTRTPRVIRMTTKPIPGDTSEDIFA